MAERREQDAGGWTPLGALHGPQGSGPEPPRNLLSLIHHLTDGVALVRDGGVVWANHALAQICGVPAPEELHGKSVQALWADTGGGAPEATPHPPTGAVVACEGRVRRADGELRCVRAWCFPSDSGIDGNRENSAEGHPSEVGPPASEEIWMIRDVSALRSTEQELQRVSWDLGCANRELAELRDRRRSEATARQDLVGFVGHELRTPISVIAGFNRLLLAEEVGAVNTEQRRFLGEMARSCERMDAFIGELLAASRESRSPCEIDPKWGSLEPTIRGVIASLRPLIEERGLVVDLRLDPCALHACFDAPRIEQVLNNVLGNALRYAQFGGRIGIGTEELRAAGRSYVCVAISDDGPGVPMDDRSRIFEPYVRGGSSNRSDGLGLGLAICRRIVEAHGGCITVESARETPTGSRFVFSLPADGTISRGER